MEQGKALFTELVLKLRECHLSMPDILAKQLYPHEPEKYSYDSAKIASEMRMKLIAEGRNYCMETVFSHPSKIDLVAHARAMSYQIILVFVHLDTDVLNQARIAQRVSEGGHSVPEEKVISRIPRLLKYIKRTLPLCDQVYILNNSRADNPFQLMATLHEGKLEIHQRQLPDWCQLLLDDY